MSWTSAPQSGVMNVAATSRSVLTMSTGRSALVGRARGQDVGHDPEREAEGEQHCDPGPLDPVAEDRREAAVRDRDDDERQPDDHRVALSGRHETRYRTENRMIQTTSTKCQYSDTASTASWCLDENWPAIPR